MPRTLGIVALILVVPNVTVAQRRTPTTELGVDVVTLNDGTRVLGAVTARTEREITLAVRRAWLKDEHPDRLEAIETRDRERREAGRLDLLDRLDAWRSEPPKQPRLREFLDAERTRLANVIEDGATRPPPASEFLFVTFPADEVRRVHVQRPSQRTIALLAWRERLDDVESRPADSLRRELERERIALPEGPVDLSDRFPSATAEDGDSAAAAWGARRAVIEYGYVEPLDFQGTGNLLVRTTGEEQPGLDEVLAAFTIRAQPFNLLDLVDPPKGGTAPALPQVAADEFETAIKEAERRGLRGFRVTRVQPELDRQRVTVESLFLAKLPAGWKPVWRRSETVDASKPRPELERRIAEDERVAEIAKTIKSLGLGGDAQLAMALRFGAATMTAQSTIDDAFFDFTEATTKSLDGP